MSHIVHSSDNLTIFWDIQEKNSDKYLYLDFSIQVNGKTKTFSFYFRLIAEKKEDEVWYLKEYREWYNIYELLGNIGYPIGDYSPEHVAGWNVIDKWIEELLQAKEDKDVFYT